MQNLRAWQHVKSLAHRIFRRAPSHRCEVECTCVTECDHMASCYTVATTSRLIHASPQAMYIFSFFRMNFTARSLRTRLVAMLLLVAQLTALLVVPLHAVAHAQDKHVSEANGNPAINGHSGKLFSSLFGHNQGLGCDEWNAAFALDSHSGVSLPNLPTVPLATTSISCGFPAEQLATPFRQFLARAPPRL